MTDYDAVAHVTTSGYRRQVLKALADDVLTPKEIEKETGIHLNHVSRTLGELKEYDLIELVVDEDRKKGRYHEITEKGEEVLSVVQERA